LLHLIAVVVEIEVVGYSVVFARNVGQNHFELKFAPTIFLDLEGWLPNGY
jgi:hypothetical protein